MPEYNEQLAVPDFVVEIRGDSRHVELAEAPAA
jgi:hypothetical protein